VFLRAECDRIAMGRAVVNGLLPSQPFPGETTIFHGAKGLV
jgi:hypothetical protein